MAVDTLQNQAYRMILERIIRREFKPGQPMREAMLASLFNTSVTPVRLALRQLEREGWLEIFPCRGAFLRRITQEEIEAYHLMREALETACIDKFIECADEQDFERLRENLEESAALIEMFRAEPLPGAEMDMKWRFVDSAFHEAIIQGSHCERLIAEARKWGMQIQVYFQSQHDERSFEERLRSKHSVLLQHRAIVLSLEMARKEGGSWKDAARALIRAHLPQAARFASVEEPVKKRRNRKRKVVDHEERPTNAPASGSGGEPSGP